MITAILKATISLFLDKKIAKVKKQQRYQDQTQTHHIDRGSTVNTELTLQNQPQPPTVTKFCTFVLSKCSLPDRLICQTLLLSVVCRQHRSLAICSLRVDPENPLF